MNFLRSFYHSSSSSQVFERLSQPQPEPSSKSNTSMSSFQNAPLQVVVAVWWPFDTHFPTPSAPANTGNMVIMQGVASPLSVLLLKGISNRRYSIAMGSVVECELVLPARLTFDTSAADTIDIPFIVFPKEVSWQTEGCVVEEEISGMDYCSDMKNDVERSQ